MSEKKKSNKTYVIILLSIFVGVILGTSLSFINKPETAKERDLRLAKEMQERSHKKEIEFWEKATY